RQAQHPNRGHGAQAGSEALLFGQPGPLHQVNMRRRLAIPQLAFGPPQSAGHPLEIAQFQAWRLKEPVSGRRYTVVELQSHGGETGYGEGGPVPAAQMAEARVTVLERRATESEFVRARLAGIPAMEAAVG